ncbi:MAG: ComEA family DNA-binding protein [Pseudomonadota bacterium]
MFANRSAIVSPHALRARPTRWGALVLSLLLAFAFAAPSMAEPDLPQIPQSVNVNTADATTIAGVLTGVGVSRAAAIIAYRERHGAFSTIDELTKVRGVGQRTLERNAGRIRLQD